jgi:hypothetical protein
LCYFWSISSAAGVEEDATFYFWLNPNPSASSFGKPSESNFGGGGMFGEGDWVFGVLVELADDELPC